MTDHHLFAGAAPWHVIMTLTTPAPHDDHVTIIYLVPELAAQHRPFQLGGFLWELFESWKPLNMTETEIIFPLSDGNNKKLLLWSAQQQHVYNK